jgi:type I restriction enzyme S subunit
MRELGYTFPEDWDAKTIGDIACHVGSGATPTGGSSVYSKTGITFIRSQNVTFKGLLLDDVAFIEPSIHRQMARSEIFPHDVLLNITGASIGRCCYVPYGFGIANVNQHVCAIRLPKPSHEDAVFLAGVLTSHIGQSQIDRLNAGGNREGLNYQQVRSFSVPWPMPEERKRIAAILEEVDEAIAKTEAVIAKLRQVRAGLLHDLLTRGFDEHGQLRDPIAHPEQFQDSPLGRIPREWRVSRLGDILQIPPRNGYSPREAPTFQGSYLLGLGCVTTEGFAPIQLKNAPLGDSGLAAFRLNDGELLISRSNTRDLVGLPAVYRDVGYPCYYPDLMMRLVPKRELSPEFLELILGHSASRVRLVASASGTSGSMVKITGAGVMEVPVAYPPGNGRDEQRDILAVKGAIERVLGTVWREHAKLSSLKSGLMDDLLTGRVRVPESMSAAENQP